MFPDGVAASGVSHTSQGPTSLIDFHADFSTRGIAAFVSVWRTAGAQSWGSGPRGGVRSLATRSETFNGLGKNHSMPQATVSPRSTSQPEIRATRGGGRVGGRPGQP